MDPIQLMEELGQFASLEGFKEMLDKAEVGQAYMERPCLDPFDPECPASAPNSQSRKVSWNEECFLTVVYICKERGVKFSQTTY